MSAASPETCLHRPHLKNPRHSHEQSAGSPTRTWYSVPIPSRWTANPRPPISHGISRNV